MTELSATFKFSGSINAVLKAVVVPPQPPQPPQPPKKKPGKGKGRR